MSWSSETEAKSWDWIDERRASVSFAEDGLGLRLGVGFRDWGRNDGGLRRKEGEGERRKRLVVSWERRDRRDWERGRGGRRERRLEVVVVVVVAAGCCSCCCGCDGGCCGGGFGGEFRPKRAGDWAWESIGSSRRCW
ncbi:hypothetical protein MLD38_030176 [Melastoma candidum]|uniref:Uncharacterized protein n=1 Tax=Melastoma candidum TaxID=119954 RepID=A0ACB9MM44_9MYRT|nr:hypothetical protein MLD38_030176 [Melastoma candidum]